MQTNKNFLMPCFISLLICFSIFFLEMAYIFVPKKSDFEAVQKNESRILYSTHTDKNIKILISVEKCPVIFLVNISTKQKNVSVDYIANSSEEKGNTRYITFPLAGFENFINFLSGIEIETPYGLPSPAKSQTIIAKNEKILAYGASIGSIIIGETSPSTEKKDYYCYIIEEICIKFLSDCTPQNYKFLKQNCDTDISYTEFYDNYKLLEDIKR